MRVGIYAAKAGTYTCPSNCKSIIKCAIKPSRLKNNNNKETDKPTPQMTVEEAEAEYIKSRSKFAQNTASNALNTFNDTLEDKKKTQKAG